MSEFDQFAGFDELCAAWRFDDSRAGRAKAQRRDAQQAYDAGVGDAEQHAVVLAAAKACMIRHEIYTRGLAQFIRIGYENFSPGGPKIAAPPPRAPAPAAAPPPPDAVMEAFFRVWTVWPRNEEFPEREQAAASFWREAARKWGVVKLEAACMQYVKRFNDPEIGVIYPRQLKTVVQDDEEIELLLEVIRRAPTPRVLAEGAAAYAAYPDYPGKVAKESDSMVFYRRHIKPPQRFAFFVACRAYASDRRMEVMDDPSAMKFTKAFNSFVAEWQHHDIRDAAETILCRAIQEACPACVRVVDNLAVAYLVGTKKLPVDEVPAEIFRRFKVENAEELGRQVIEAVYEKACKKLGVVLNCKVG